MESWLYLNVSAITANVIIFLRHTRKIFFTVHKCPLGWDEGLQINIKEYQDLERNNSDRK